MDYYSSDSTNILDTLNAPYNIYLLQRIKKSKTFAIGAMILSMSSQSQQSQVDVWVSLKKDSPVCTFYFMVALLACVRMMSKRSIWYI